MKIGIIGAGSVGKTLGEKWKERGHEIRYGGRQAEPSRGLVTTEESVRDADVVVIAVPWPAVHQVLHNAGLFSGKVVVDCTNPIAADFGGLSIAGTDSAGETISRLLPASKVIKAFNTCGSNIMEDPRFAEGNASMFIAGDDRDAKATVSSLAVDIGFDPVDVGPLEQSRYLEAAAWLWISFKLLQRE
jgi:8-hydroxy-5-deazaflavin:NADPH oxidoreductase